MAYFDSKRDNELITAGGFFCQACLVGKPSGEQSADSRYCQGCFDVLSKEAKILGRGKKDWVPIKGVSPATNKPVKPSDQREVALQVKTLPKPPTVFIQAKGRRKQGLLL